MADMRDWKWYEITYCERENAYDEMIPAEWFILNAPYPSKEEAERIQAKRREDLKGTDAEWPEADASAKIVHGDELGQYGLKPLNEEHKDEKDEELTLAQTIARGIERGIMEGEEPLFINLDRD